jgi:prolyl-tRNA synthetase
MAGSITRMSQLFLRTLRESPTDADVPSHQLLVRAGYIRRAAPGIYTWLPLGLEVLRNVERVVREEMRAIGGQEVLFPALLPREPYQVTGRWEEYGDLLFRLKDRRGSEYLLGPTHEEMFTQLVKDLYSSYKDFPLTLFQIQTKYRDEARPRGGILRGREFVMKDSYSFDLDDEGLEASYLAHRKAYQAIFRRLGLDFRIVSAVSGAMGGSASEEFLAPSPVGEDTFVSCPSCGYAANVEAVTVAAPEPQDPAAHPPLEELATPNTPTIERLADRLGVAPAQTLKCLVVKADGEPILVLVPGDREADMDRLAGQLAPAKVELFTPEDFEDHPQLAKGYVGPQGAAGRGLTVYADRRVAVGSAWVTGANAVDTHARFVVNGRDFTVERYLDVATVHSGDPCPRCGEPLALEQAIEIGHIFQLGRKYADAFTLDAAGQDGKPVRITMGSYGIGVTRAVAAVAEQTHDEFGLCWPHEIAPADVHVVAVGKGDEVLTVAEELSGRLAAAGWRVLLDDRRVAPGVAFADADLLGVGIHIVVGKALAGGQVEIKRRQTGDRHLVALTGAVEAVSQELRAATPPSPPPD